MAMICDKENRNNVNLSQPSAENKTLTEIPRSFCGHSKAKQKLFREVVNESCVVSFAAQCQHGSQLGNIFCEDCLSYNICEYCSNTKHSHHKLHVFPSFEVAKEQTKPILLQELEETLRKLKSRENEIENRNLEIELISSRLRTAEEELLNMVRDQFQKMQNSFKINYRQAVQRYQCELTQFYQEHNRINETLRTNLMDIIESRISAGVFNPSCVRLQVSQKTIPQFGRMKTCLQKCKRFCRDIKVHLKSLQETVASLQFDRASETHQKYDKFIREQNECGDTPRKVTLIRTLQMISSDEFQFLKRGSVFSEPGHCVQACKQND